MSEIGALHSMSSELSRLVREQRAQAEETIALLREIRERLQEMAPPASSANEDE